MILKKELSAPVYRRRSIRRRLALFTEKTGAITAGALHFRQSDAGLCCAEGATELGQLPEDGVLVTATGHALSRFVFEGGELDLGGTKYFFGSLPAEVLSYASAEGDTEYFALAEDGCYLLRAEAEAERISDGGTCGCVHGERLFFAHRSTVFWTKPLNPGTVGESIHGAGHVELPSSLGDIHTLVSYDGKLYIFRKYGIMRLTAPGNELNFYAEEVPYAGGEIFAGTVRSCGGRIVFLAQCGLFTLTGTTCRRLSGCGDGYLDLDHAATAVAGGKYYATAKYEGERCIWCVEPEEGRGHLIRMRAEQLAGGENLVFAEGGKVYALTDRGLPAVRRSECVLKTEYSFLGLSSLGKFLDGITIEGTGNFRVEARGEHGLSRTVSGRAGEPMRFPLPVRGKGFTLDIRTIEAGASIRALIFDLREEVAPW